MVCYNIQIINPRIGCVNIKCQIAICKHKKANFACNLLFELDITLRHKKVRLNSFHFQQMQECQN